MARLRIRLATTPASLLLAATLLCAGARAAVVPAASDTTVATPPTAASSTTASPAATTDATAYLRIDAPSAVLAGESSSSSPAVNEPPVKDMAEAMDYFNRSTRSERHAIKVENEAQRNTDCETGVLHGKPCRESWIRTLGESVIFLAAQHGGNIWMDDDTRNALKQGHYWSRYETCVENYRWSRWKDDDPFGVDYIGHPLMGGFTNSIYEQNDPKQRALSFELSRRYWMGRLRATAYSAAYSVQWKIGPASEASIGNTGIGYYLRDRDGVITNETGMQDFFITPIGGLAWNVGEDALDRYVLQRIRRATKNKVLLFASSFITPARSGANITRGRAPYYRDPDAASIAAHTLR